MHQKINELYESVRRKNYDLQNKKGILDYLCSIGASKTEAWLVLCQGFKIDEDTADSIVVESNIWDDEDPLETMYQVALYLKDTF